jgi:hypothetical protein
MQPGPIQVPYSVFDHGVAAVVDIESDLGVGVVGDERVVGVVDQ